MADKEKTDTGESTAKLLENVLKGGDPNVVDIYAQIIKDRTDKHGAGDTAEAKKLLEYEGLHGFRDSVVKKK
jgi:hypothetical protein